MTIKEKRKYVLDIIETWDNECIEDEYNELIAGKYIKKKKKWLQLKSIRKKLIT